MARLYERVFEAVHQCGLSSEGKLQIQNHANFVRQRLQFASVSNFFDYLKQKLR